MPRPRHPDPDSELILRKAEAQGWTVTRGKRYFKMKCPCEDKHMKMMHITPNRNYLRECVRQLKRTTCWKD